MAGTVSFPNIGSSIDVQSIINAYVSAESVTQSQMKQQVTDLQSASTSISSISTNLATLSSALSALADAQTVQSYAATSSGTEVAANVTGAAQSGSYSVEVLDTAKEYRAYSSTLGTSATDAANLSGVLHIDVGSGSSADIVVTAYDSINNIVGAINSAGLRVSASTFYDGTSYRIQLRGLDSGDDNKVMLSGLDLGFSDSGNLIQQASNAKVKIDGHTVSSATNQINGAVPGLSLAVSAKTSQAVTVNVKADPQGLATKVQTMVSAYNAVVNQIHTTSGYGTTKASVSRLAGDATLRSITDAMSRTVLTEIDTGTEHTTLGSLGISLQKDGTLSLDSTKLTEAVTNDSASVVSILAGASGGKGVMDLLGSVAKSYDEAGIGILAAKTSSMTQQISAWNDHIDREQARIDNYTSMLQSQFTAMTTSLSASTSMANYLSAVLGTTITSGTSSSSSSK